MLATLHDHKRNDAIGGDDFPIGLFVRYGENGAVEFIEAYVSTGDVNPVLGEVHFLDRPIGLVLEDLAAQGLSPTEVHGSVHIFGQQCLTVFSPAGVVDGVAVFTRNS